MIKMLESRREKLIISFISGKSHSEHLYGLQILCRELENGIKIVDPKIYTQLVLSHFFSPFPKIRRWAYYSSQLLRLHDGRDPLRYSLLRESDEECRLWAWKAFTSLSSSSEINKLMLDPNFNYWETNLELISISNEHEGRSPSTNLTWGSVTDDIIASRWVGISFGYGSKLPEFEDQISTDRFLIQKLQLHEDITVAEYAIWAFYNRSDGSSNELLIPIDVIGDKSPGIRAWAYQLLFKDNINPLKEELSIQLIGSELSAQDVTAKRGLARSFRTFYWVGMENMIIPWLEDENDAATRFALIEHMIIHHRKCMDYEREVLRIYRNLSEGSVDHLHIQLAIKQCNLPRSSDLEKTIGMLENLKAIRGDFFVGNKIEIGSVGDINAKVANFGDMRNAVIDSLLHAEHGNILSPIKAEVERFVDMLVSDSSVEEEIKVEALKSIEKVSSSDSGSIKGSAEMALSALKKIQAAANCSTDIVVSATKIMEALGSYLS